LIALNDNHADGKDVSWIWDAELEELPSSNLFITGRRAHEMALCLAYASKNPTHVGQNIHQLVRLALSHTPKGKTLCVIPTYTAMLELRKVLLGRKIL